MTKIEYTEQWSTYMMATYQLPAQKSWAASKRAIPMRAMVGAMAKGPMYLSNKPTMPNMPMRTSNREAVMMAPWIWKEKTDSVID